MTHRIGIIGLGVMGQRMMNILSNDNRFAVVAIADQDEHRLHEVSVANPDAATHTDGKALISQHELDLVYIATPPSSHVEYAELALDHQNAVLCEKPLSVNLDDSQRLVNKAKASGLPNALIFREHPCRRLTSSNKLYNPAQSVITNGSIFSVILNSGRVNSSKLRVTGYQDGSRAVSYVRSSRT